MKKIIICLITIATLGSCNNSDTKEIDIDPLTNVSWESEKDSKYQLVRPLDYDKEARDVFQLPIRPGQWYVITKGTDCYLSPVYTDATSGPGFVENMIRWKKLAVIDTMYAGLMSNTKKFQGFLGISTMEILCFKEGYNLQLTTTTTGQMTVFEDKQ